MSDNSCPGIIRRIYVVYSSTCNDQSLIADTDKTYNYVFLKKKLIR